MSKGISTQKRYRVLDRDGYKCRYCGAVAPDVHLVMDHVVPRNMGGRDYEENLVAACEECNSGKSDAMPSQSFIDAVKAETLRHRSDGDDVTQCDMCVNPGLFTHPLHDAVLCGSCFASFKAGIRAIEAEKQ